MKRIYILLVIVTSLFGYLQWGGQQQMFLFQMEAQIFRKKLSDPLAVLHPFTIFPILGQCMLMAGFIKDNLSLKWMYAAIGCIGILFAMILLVGVISLNMKILLSAIPFILASVWLIRVHKHGA